MTDRTDNWTAFREAQVVSGDVIEVGLGAGRIALSVVAEDKVTSYTAYERDAAVVTRFKAENPLRSDKIVLVEEDFILSVRGTAKYDVGIIDTLEAFTAEYFDAAWLYAQELEQRMNVGGRIIMEWQGRLPIETDLRGKMGRRYGAMQTEFIQTNDMRTSRHIGYYQL